jgi:hypothetical protein
VIESAEQILRHVLSKRREVIPMLEERHVTLEDSDLSLCALT